MNSHINNDKSAQDKQPILSPRYFLKFFLSNTNINTSTNNNSLSQCNSTLNLTNQFQSYLQSVQPLLQIYHKKNNQKKIYSHVSQQKQAQIQYQMQQSEIPKQFFNSSYCLTFSRKNLNQQYQALVEYLDEIQIKIFNKLAKYPPDSISLISSVCLGYQQINEIIKKIKQIRNNLKSNSQKVVKRHQKVIFLNKKIQNIKKVINKIQFMDKIKKIKDLSHQNKQIDRINTHHYQFMQSIKLQDINKVSNIICLKNIIIDIQIYRENIKFKISKQFQQDLSIILKSLLTYNKQQWLTNQIPNNAFTVLLDEQQNNLNCSMMNISILDQSLFEIHPANLISSIQSENFSNFCKLINLYQIWDEIQVSEIVTRNLLKNNVKFMTDLDHYISYILQLKGIKVKNGRSIYQYIEMRFYFKLIKVYYELLKQTINFIRNNRKQFSFLYNTIPKIHDFIVLRIKCFLQLKPINKNTTKDDLFHYISLIQYWIIQQQLYQKLAQIKKQLLEQHIIALHTSVLITQLRSAVQKSNFSPISIPSDYFLPLQLILSWTQSNIQSQEKQMLQTSMSFFRGQIEQPPLSLKSSKFKVVNKVFILQGKSFRVCQSFLVLIKYLQHYIQLHMLLQDMRLNIQQKILQVIGSYIWYNKKILMPEKSQSSKQKSIRSICIFISMVELIRHIVSGFNIKNQKKNKLAEDIEKCFQMIKQQISLAPLLMLQDQVQRIYESRITQRKQIPTKQSIKMIQILKNCSQCFRQFFDERKCIYLMTPSIKMINKNYFGYLINMQKRGKQELKWFLNSFKQILGNWFEDDLSSMTKQLKLKQ